MKIFYISAFSLLWLAPLFSEESLVPIENRVSDYDARLALARMYSHKKETKKLSFEEYSMLLHEKPEDTKTLIEFSGLLIEMKKYSEAIMLLNEALEKEPEDRNLLVVLAQAEAARGHAKRARELFLQVLEKKSDSEILEKYADAMMTWGDFYKATAIYQDLPSSADRSVKLAWSYGSSEQYEKADEVINQALETFPENSKIPKEKVKLLYQEYRFEEALSEANGKIKGDILYAMQRYPEALEAYESVDDYVGIGKTYKKLGLYENAHEAFLEALAENSENIEAAFLAYECEAGNACFFEKVISSDQLLEWGDNYNQNDREDLAHLMFLEAVKKDPENFDAQIRLAESFSSIYCHCAAIEIYQNLLDQFPENAKLMKAIARNLAWSKNYVGSIQYYDSILEINPEDRTLYLEKARVALWGKFYCLSMNTYDRIDAILEKRAKSFLWNKQFIHSLDAFSTLIKAEPVNQEAEFDLGQSYCVLGLCDESRKVYKDILHLNSGHSLVKLALKQNELLLRPAIKGNLMYWRELGTGTFSQSQIARYRLDTLIEYPLSCRAHVRFMQTEYVENPFYNFKFYPAEGQTIEGDYTFNESVKWLSSATCKNYFGEFKSTYTSKNFLYFNLQDALQITLACNREDEIYNYFSLKQASQSIDSWLTASTNLNRYWNIEGTYQYYAYNDNNNQKHVNLKTEIQLSEDPYTYKIILQGNYRNTKHDSILIIVGETLVDVIHPYWTPIDYYSGVITLQYRRDYRYFEFCEAPQRYVDFKVSFETDSTNNPSVELVVEWKHEFIKNGGLELKGLIHRSKQWNAEGFWASMYYRF